MKKKECAKNLTFDTPSLPSCEQVDGKAPFRGLGGS